MRRARWGWVAGGVALSKIRPIINLFLTNFVQHRGWARSWRPEPSKACSGAVVQ